MPATWKTWPRKALKLPGAAAAPSRARLALRPKAKSKAGCCVGASWAMSASQGGADAAEWGCADAGGMAPSTTAWVGHCAAAKMLCSKASASVASGKSVCPASHSSKSKSFCAASALLMAVPCKDHSDSESAVVVFTSFLGAAQAGLTPDSGILMLIFSSLSAFLKSPKRRLRTAGFMVSSSKAVSAAAAGIGLATGQPCIGSPIKASMSRWRVSKAKLMPTPLYSWPCPKR